MGLRIFLVVLFVIAGIVMTLPITSDDQKKKNANLPLVKFEEAIMYTMDEKEVTQIIKADTALRFKNRDEMYEANFVTRTNDTNKELDIINAKKVIKRNDKLNLSGDVLYNRGDIIQFKTQVLNYNTKTKIAQNKHKFWALYNGNEFTGTNLYANTNDNTILADKPHFIINESKQ